MESKARHTLGELLTGHDIYYGTFDPMSDMEAHRSTLSNDLAEIYGGLKEELSRDENAREIGEDETERLWHWRWQFRNHWGKFHFPPAMAAICWLLFQYWDEDEEEWSTRT